MRDARTDCAVNLLDFIHYDIICLLVLGGMVRCKTRPLKIVYFEAKLYYLPHLSWYLVAKYSWIVAEEAYLLRPVVIWYKGGVCPIQLHKPLKESSP